MQKKFDFYGELALFIAIIINSLGVTLMVKSGFGISAISSVPYIFSRAFAFISFGTWNYLFQTALVLTLIIIKSRFEWGYAFSFVVGILFGKMIDIHELWVSLLPINLGLQILYFAIGFIILAVGICFANNCMLPIVPTDIFPRDLSQLINKPYKKVKTAFDLICLIVTVIISVIMLNKIIGIGMGSVLCALIMGKTISFIQKICDEKFVFKRYEFSRVKKEFI